jgi:protein-disulfide isomerase
LDVARFRSDLASHAHAARIERDVQEGIRNGVNATPKFYVNGERIDGKVPLEGLVDAVRAAVTAASANLTIDSGAADG